VPEGRRNSPEEAEMNCKDGDALATIRSERSEVSDEIQAMSKLLMKCGMSHPKGRALLLNRLK
jgi:hypothetical protein